MQLFLEKLTKILLVLSLGTPLVFFKPLELPWVSSTLKLNASDFQVKCKWSIDDCM